VPLGYPDCVLVDVTPTISIVVSAVVIVVVVVARCCGVVPMAVLALAVGSCVRVGVVVVTIFSFVRCDGFMDRDPSPFISTARYSVGLALVVVVVVAAADVVVTVTTALLVDLR